MLIAVGQKTKSLSLVRMSPDGRPVSLGIVTAGGHASWNGHDGDWFFINTKRRTDKPSVFPLKWGGKIIAGKADDADDERR